MTPPRRLVIPIALLFCARVLAASSTQPIELDSPHEYQVFQRGPDNTAQVLLKGRITQSEGPFECRVDDGEWIRISYADQPPHGFATTVSVAAGKWHRIYFVAHYGDIVNGSLTVEHVGAGEVFIVVGQSNATNYGAEPQKPRSDHVVNFDGQRWRIANDPQAGTQDKSSKGSFMPAFGDAMYAKYKVPIAVVPCGAGSSSVRQWLPKGSRFDVPPTKDSFVRQVAPNEWECTGELFDGLMSRINALGPHGFRAVLWHQGESDADQSPEHEITPQRYAELMTKLIQESKKQAGWDFPWFVAQASYHNEKVPSIPAFRTAQESLWKSGLAVQGPDTDTLGPAYRAGIHMNAKGLQAHGQLWAEKVSAYLDPILAKP
jgi:hypothetical protein